MATERGRSANTLTAYRRDLHGYWSWVSAHGTDLRNVDRRCRHVRQRTPRRGSSGVVGRSSGCRDPHAAPLSRRGGRSPGRSDRRPRGHPTCPPASPIRCRRMRSLAARRAGHQRAGRSARSGAARAALRDRGAHLRGVRAVARRLRSRRADGQAVRQGIEGADRSVRAVRGARRCRNGSARRAARTWSPSVGHAAATPKQCS